MHSLKELIRQTIKDNVNIKALVEDIIKEELQSISNGISIDHTLADLSSGKKAARTRELNQRVRAKTDVVDPYSKAVLTASRFGIHVGQKWEGTAACLKGRVIEIDQITKKGIYPKILSPGQAKKPLRKWMSPIVFRKQYKMVGSSASHKSSKSSNHSPELKVRVGQHWTGRVHDVIGRVIEIASVNGSMITPKLITDKPGANGVSIPRELNTKSFFKRYTLLPDGASSLKDSKPQRIYPDISVGQKWLGRISPVKGREVEITGVTKDEIKMRSTRVRKDGKNFPVTTTRKYFFFKRYDKVA